jgi:hypothetical protein
MTSEDSSPTSPATIRRRLAASLYEALLLTAIALLVGFATLPAVAPPPSTVALNAPVPLPTRPARALSFVSLFLAWGVYCVGFWANGRRTLPMKTWRLALRAADGRVPTWWKAGARYLACWVGPACAVGAYVVLRGHGPVALALVPLALNYGWAFFDRDRQFLQDRIAGTQLILRR